MVPSFSILVASKSVLQNKRYTYYCDVLFWCYFVSRWYRFVQICPSYQKYVTRCYTCYTCLILNPNSANFPSGSHRVFQLSWRRNLFSRTRDIPTRVLCSFGVLLVFFWRSFVLFLLRRSEVTRTNLFYF